MIPIFPDPVFSTDSLDVMELRMFKPPRPFWLGFAVAPLSVPLLYAGWFVMFFHDTTPKQEAGEVLPSFMMYIFVPASYIVSLVMGLPLILFLRRIHRLSFCWVTLGAAPLGASALAALMLCAWEVAGHAKGSLWLALAGSAGLGALFSVVVAAAFCWVVGISHCSKRTQNTLGA